MWTQNFAVNKFHKLRPVSLRRRTAPALKTGAVAALAMLLAAPCHAQKVSPLGLIPNQSLQPQPAPQGPVPEPGMAQPQPEFGQTQGGDGQPQEPQPQPQPSYGFNAPSPQPGTEPARPNYADELTDFGVPPQSTLQANVGSPTPTTIPGGHVITTNEVRQAVGSNVLVIDVLDTPQHPTLPGAILLPGAGSPGSFDDMTQQRLWTRLSQLTDRQPNRPLVFLCSGSRCWESYNAALRAISMGFKMVMWYRGGLGAWTASGGPMTGAPSQGAFSQQGRIGFGQ